MKRIISIRLKSGEGVRSEFVRGSEGTVQAKIINMLKMDPYGDYEYLISEDLKRGQKKSANQKDSKYIADYDKLAGEVINIVNDEYIAEFTEDDDGYAIVLVSSDSDVSEAASPQSGSVRQLGNVMRQSASTDIGGRIADIYNKIANVQYYRNPIYTGIETQDDIYKANKKFIPNANLRHILPYSNYPIVTKLKEGALPQQKTVDQLNALRKLTKSTDIGDRSNDGTKKAGNAIKSGNAIDHGVESIQSYNSFNKKNFVPNWNLKGLMPDKGYPMPINKWRKKRKKKK